MPSGARHGVNRHAHSSLVHVRIYSHDCSMKVWHQMYCELKMNFSSFYDSFFVRNKGGVCSCLVSCVQGGSFATAAHKMRYSGEAVAMCVFPGLLY